MRERALVGSQRRSNVSGGPGRLAEIVLQRRIGPEDGGSAEQPSLGLAGMTKLVKDDSQKMRQQSFGHMFAEKARIAVKGCVQIASPMPRRGLLETERCRARHAGASTPMRRARST